MHHNHNDRASSATRKLAKFSSRPSSTSSSSLYYCFCFIFSLLLFNRSKVKSLHSAAQTVDKKSTFKKMKKELRARRTCPGVQPNWRRSPSARNNTKWQTRGGNARPKQRGQREEVNIVATLHSLATYSMIRYGLLTGSRTTFLPVLPGAQNLLIPSQRKRGAVLVVATACN